MNRTTRPALRIFRTSTLCNLLEIGAAGGTCDNVVSHVIQRVNVLRHLWIRENKSAGAVRAETRLRLIQRGSGIFGRYQGGSIVGGCLVGQVNGYELTFRYAQREREGGIHGGRSSCVLEVLSDGRLRIHEHFAWKT